jgi:hypothetical protein
VVFFADWAKQVPPIPTTIIVVRDLPKNEAIIERLFFCFLLALISPCPIEECGDDRLLNKSLT